MASQLRAALRKRLWWIRFQEINREGWRDAYTRRRLQNLILQTPPLRTDRDGDVEVRALTWRRDWKNLIWALKSFYHFSDKRYPLYVHDGGITPEGADAVRLHFPDVHFVAKQQADAAVDGMFAARRLNRCMQYRTKNPTTQKLFDFFALSQARTVFSIDSDIVFFAEPRELLEGHPGKNVYNRDSEFWYSMTVDAMEERFQLRPVSHLNSGLARIDRRSIDFEAIEGWLEEPRLFDDNWVTEQTLHALCAAQYGVVLLPPVYAVSTKPGIIENAVCKHYPGNVRPLLYREGMRRLIDSGFLAALAASKKGARQGPAAVYA